MIDIEPILKQNIGTIRFHGTPGTFHWHACILTKPDGILKYILKTPGNAIFETLNFKMLLDALALNIVPLVQVPEWPSIHYQPATLKLFDSPDQ